MKIVLVIAIAVLMYYVGVLSHNLDREKCITQKVVKMYNDKNHRVNELEEALASELLKKGCNNGI